MSAPNQQQHKNMLGHCIADGRLELVSVLGLGAYGVVYLARDLQHPLHQQPYASSSRSGDSLPTALASSHGAAASGYYAVKCLNKVGLDERQRTFQRREITLHALASQHPSVVTLHRVIDTDDDPCVYVIMDYCPDGDLFSMITERQRYAVAQPPAIKSKSSRSRSPSQDAAVADVFDGEDPAYWRERVEMDKMVKSVFFQILDAVQYCHTYGIYHRDLKPENILCLQDGARVVLADFGLATGDRDSSDFGCGSTFYMGPECQGGITTRLARYDTAANDVWSLGVILVNLVCGRNPWKQACPADETFREYLRNPNFLQDILPISDETNELLKRVFTVREDWRCSVAELRKMVENITRFTATHAEMASRQEAARVAADRARALTHAQQNARALEQQQQQRQAEAEAALREQEYLRTPANGFAQALDLDEEEDEDVYDDYDNWSEVGETSFDAVHVEQPSQVSRQPSCEVDWAQHPIAAQPGTVRRALISEASVARDTRASSTPSSRTNGHSAVQPPLSPTSSDRSSPRSACDSDSTPDSSSLSASSRRSSASFTGLPPTPRFNAAEIAPPAKGDHMDVDFRLDALAIRNGGGYGPRELPDDCELPFAKIAKQSPLECEGAVKIPRSPRRDCFRNDASPPSPTSRKVRRGLADDTASVASSTSSSRTGLSADDMSLYRGERQASKPAVAGDLDVFSRAADVFDQFSFVAPPAPVAVETTSRFATMPGRRAAPSPAVSKHHQHQAAVQQAVRRARGQVSNLALAFQRPHHLFGQRAGGPQ
ncbi:kinase-like protein [Tilletiopsis washingtonensis]|uniref:Kinase-like protein n=1 Tax=Tilletiopsis washingtonensis TaxID=58919 RepID=A0A316ZK98_9BASI|nr:kinase-like protein [Tilletiopsis washingtonensis]PWO01237.1 kinase-like protein [Tilletiopsis washingtonensis]